MKEIQDGFGYLFVSPTTSQYLFTRAANGPNANVYGAVFPMHSTLRQNQWLVGDDECLFRARHIQPRYMDIGLISKWLSLCETRHGNSCLPGRVPWSVDYCLCIIDVKDGRMVNALVNCRYISLSCVWGRVEQVSLSGTTLPILINKGAIFSEFGNLSSAIKDAIFLCQRLGFR